MMRFERSTAVTVALASAILTIGCAASDNVTAGNPTPIVSVLVTNYTCSAGHCDSIEVLAFPSNRPVTPGGLWNVSLGVVTTPTACLTLHAADTARVSGPDSTGTVKTTLYIWTPSLPVSIGWIRPGDGRLMASPITTDFVPVSAAGWTVTLPGPSPDPDALEVVGTRAVGSCTSQLFRGG
jgi:hypothetical protein